MKDFQVVTTKDGSKTIWIPKRDVYYHSLHGAVSEAQHVYIEHGLTYFKRPSLTILEMGFGTALNAFMTFLASVKKKQKISYVSVDNHPLTYELVEQLDYPNFLGVGDDEHILRRMHGVDWNHEIPISSQFSLLKANTSIEALSLDKKIDLVFYDAFAPRACQTQWTESVFRNLSKCLTDNAIIVTYCANGQVKRNLKAVGFEVESLKGPPGKREMIRATWLK